MKQRGSKAWQTTASSEPEAKTQAAASQKPAALQPGISVIAPLSRRPVASTKGGRPRTMRIRWLSAGLATIIAILLGIGIWYLGSRSTAESLNTDYVQRLNKLVMVPENSRPEILTVTDNTKVTQAFLDEAQNGDKILLYNHNAMAVLYRPSEGHVIKVGHFTPPTAKVFVRQGAKTGNTSSVEATIAGQKGLSVGSKDKAARTNYAETIVVDVSGKFFGAADNLAQALGAKVSTLPEGESQPDADLLVIVGTDKINQ